MAMTTTLAGTIAQPVARRRSPLRAARLRPLATVAAAVLLIWLAVILFAPLIATQNPLTQSLPDRLRPPSSQYLFGTDKLGRDLFSRVAYGARISIPIGVMVIALAATIGTALGAVAGFTGGVLDELLMRVTDVFLAFPPIILALAIAAALGPDMKNAMLALVAVWWPAYARMMRGVTLSIKQHDYVLASVAIGAGSGRLLRRTILPNAFMPLLVLATVDIGSGITAAAALSYLGLGVQAPAPEWGALVASGAEALDQWWLATFPGLAILTVVLAFNLVGDAVQELLDPRLRGE